MYWTFQLQWRFMALLMSKKYRIFQHAEIQAESNMLLHANIWNITWRHFFMMWYLSHLDQHCLPRRSPPKANWRIWQFGPVVYLWYRTPSSSFDSLCETLIVGLPYCWQINIIYWPLCCFLIVYILQLFMNNKERAIHVSSLQSLDLLDPFQDYTKP